MATTHLPLFLRTLATALLCTLLAGCPGDSGSPDQPAPPAPDPLHPYKTQKLNWQPCDIKQPDLAGEETQQQLKKLGSRARCAQIRAPRDYADVSKGELKIGLLRVAAEHKPAQRVMLLNPGGPGGDAQRLTVGMASLLTSGNPESEGGALLKQLSQTVDLVGFSPRGLGLSTHLSCKSSQLKLTVTDENTPENIAALDSNARNTAQACQASPIAGYINTEQTAHDMDLIRILLGHETIDYLGYSYGTWLGSWYARRYPQHVGRFVLDSTMDITNTFYVAEQNQDGAFQRLLDEVLAPYAAAHNDAFNLGTSVDTIRAILPGLEPELRALTRTHIRSDAYSSKDADTVVQTLAAAAGLDTLRRNNPGANWDAIHALLPAYPFAPGHDYDAAIREIANEMAISLAYPDEPKPINVSPTDAVSLVVQCNDTPHPGFEAAMSDAVAQMQRYPMADLDSSIAACAYWKLPLSLPPSLDLLQNTHALIVQSQYDGATRAEGALNTFKAMPAAHMVYVPGEYTHSVAFRIDNQCVDTLVARYLLGMPPAARENICPAGKLPLDRTSDDEADDLVPFYADLSAARAAQRALDTVVQESLKQ